MLINLDKEEIRKIINNPNKSWVHIGSSNCIMYALKLDMDVSKLIPKTENFTLGKLSGNELTSSDPEEVKKVFIEDLNVIGLNAEEIDPYTDVLNVHEWKVASYISKDKLKLRSGEEVYDYHLIRQDYNSKNWTHKPGVYGMVDKVKFKGLGKKKLERAKLSTTYNNEKVYYDYIETYKISTK